MTVRELIDLLGTYSEDMQVVVSGYEQTTTICPQSRFPSFPSH